MAKDLTGQKLNKLLIIKRIGSTRGGSRLWICRCECGKEVSYSSDHLTRKKNPVKSCGCLKKSMKGSNHPQWGGYGDISGGWWRDHVVRSAMGSNLSKSTRKPLSLTISIEDAWNLFVQQGKKCALSGLSIRIDQTNKYNTASLDRINSEKGYDLGNIQWVHKHVNIMKNKFDQDYFINICKLISDAYEI